MSTQEAKSQGAAKVTTWILFGIIAGAVVGQFLYDPTWNASKPIAEHAAAFYLQLFDFIGFSIFMALLKMLVLPLVMISVIVAVTSVGDVRKLGRLGGWALVYYVSTMLLAVSLGLLLVAAIAPGAGFDTQQISPTFENESVTKNAAGGLIGVFKNLVAMLIPENLFSAMAQGNTLSVITFSLFFAAVITLVEGKTGALVTFFRSLYEVIFRMVEVVLWIAPIGVFCLLAWSVARIGMGVFSSAVGVYMITVVGGLLIHGLVVLPAIFFALTRTNPFAFLLRMRPALLTAFGTDSSAATLPVTMETAITEGGVQARVAGLVLPLGATINMDGTALYEAAAVVFMAQAFGIELGLAEYILVAITATLAAIGAASVPSAGLVTMVIVIAAVNQSLQSIDPNTAIIPMMAIGLIIGVDRILDMVRTTVNVWGDAVGAKILSDWFARQSKLEGR